MSFGVIPFDLNFPNINSNPVDADVLFGYDTEGEVNAAFTLAGIKAYIGGGDWDSITGKPTTFAPSAHTLGSHSNVNSGVDSAADGRYLKKVAGVWTAVVPDFALPGDIPDVPDWVLGITESQIANWDSAFGWGDHSEAGYLTEFTETDPTVPDWVKDIEEEQPANWDSAFGWGNHADAGYLTEFTETDPVFTASVAYGITLGDKATWDAKALEFASITDNTLLLLSDGLPTESGILATYSENPFDPEEDPEEYEEWEKELLYFTFPVPVKGVEAVEDDEFVVKGQLKHNDLPDLQGGKPAEGENPAERYHSDKNQHDAIEAANNPSAENPFATMEDVEEATFSGKHSDLDLDDGPNPHGTKHSDLTLDDGRNPHGLTKADINLGAVNNTSDENKPVSGPQQAALDLKANISDLAPVAWSGNFEDLVDVPDFFEIPLPPWVYDGNPVHIIPDGSEYGENWLFIDVTGFWWRGDSYPTRGLVIFYPSIDGKKITLYTDRISPEIGDEIYLQIKYLRQ